MNPPPEHRHRQPGRRETDRTNFAAGALVTAATDGLFPGWNRKKVAEVMGIIIAASTIWGMFTTCVASKLATRSEIGGIRDTIGVVAKRQDSLSTRVTSLEDIRQRDAQSIRQMDVNMMRLVRLRCMEITEEQAYLVQLPCDSLLTPRQRRERPQ